MRPQHLLALAVLLDLAASNPQRPPSPQGTVSELGHTFRQRTITDSVASRARLFTPSTRRTLSSLYNPARSRQNNPKLFGNRRVNFLRPKTLPPLIVATASTTTTTTEATTAIPQATTYSAAYSGVNYVTGDNPVLVTLGEHENSSQTTAMSP
jgi:hypothetical protein